MFLGKPLNFLEFNIEDEALETKINNKEKAQYIICAEIKKQGGQKKFCEEKFLNSEEVKKTLSIFKKKIFINREKE